jgi:Tol biopolymer transport system component
VKRGHERLVSAGGGGAGSGASAHPSVNANGEYVAFESTATNLCAGSCAGVSGDRNGSTSDIFRRTMSSSAPTHDRMEMASFSYGANAQGNGASNNPVISSAGQFILFDSAATNLKPKSSMVGTDPNGHVRDVFLWNFSPSRGYGNVSRESRPANNGAFAQPSTNPATSSHGNYVAFTCDAGGLKADGTGGPTVPNVFMRFLGGA